MGRILSGNATSLTARRATRTGRYGVRAVLAAAVLAGAASAPFAMALDSPLGNVNPATTQPASTTQPTTAPSAGASSTSKEPEAPKPGPNGHIVQKGNLTLEVRADGLFQPVDVYELRPVFKAYAGPLQITSIAPAGARVKKGDTLLECETSGINWAVSAAENDLATAKANLAKAASDLALGAIGDQMSLKATEDGVKNAEAGKKWFEEVDGPHMLKTTDLLVKQSQNSHDDQDDELDQLRKMYKDEGLTSATADIVVKRAVRALDNAKLGLKMQQERREKVKAFDYPITKQRVMDAIDGAKQQLALTKAAQAQTAVTRQAALNAAKIGFEQATRRAADLREDLNWFSVKAPADGVVQYGTLVEGQWVGGDPRALRAGERVASGQIVMRVFTPGKMKVVLNVPESQSLWLEPGMKAKVVPAARPHHPIEAKCGPVEIVPRGNPASLGFQVTVEVGDVDPRLLPGMRASVVIDAGGAENVPLVPVAALAADKVQVRGKDGEVGERTVKVGKSDGQSVEIRSGLKEGEEVVLPGKK